MERNEYCFFSKLHIIWASIIQTLKDSIWLYMSGVRTRTQKKRKKQKQTLILNLVIAVIILVS